MVNDRLEVTMPVFSIWESRFPAQASEEGREITRSIWRDMSGYHGYLSHELIEDLDDPGHLMVVSQWTTREQADTVLREYVGHPNACRANELVSQPRTRFLGRPVSA
jgi:quinol monooxygenase YgiN